MKQRVPRIATKSAISGYPCGRYVRSFNAIDQEALRQKTQEETMSSNSEAKSLLDELRFDKGDIFDLGHPLLNWTAQSFVKTAGTEPIKSTDITGVKNKKQGFPGLRGLAAGLYSGLTYGLKEARGSHDWTNSAVAGAITGMAVALTCDNTTH
ncbi:hypothetical protein Gohar_027227 [Gossypium harknessii]|uniref:Outer envelope pore protein 16-2, chloroplastic-like n=1 Tax=Gossypium harknessii TaxID=34285 RepID=A0A7J9HUR8_9ROSI|nr:hypothetical protein [Gossypium harknessii]